MHAAPGRCQVGGLTPLPAAMSAFPLDALRVIRFGGDNFCFWGER